MGFQAAVPSGERSEDKKLSQNPSHCFSVPPGPSLRVHYPIQAVILRARARDDPILQTRRLRSDAQQSVLQTGPALEPAGGLNHRAGGLLSADSSPHGCEFPSTEALRVWQGHYGPVLYSLMGGPAGQAQAHRVSSSPPSSSLYPGEVVASGFPL